MGSSAKAPTNDINTSPEVRARDGADFDSLIGPLTGTAFQLAAVILGEPEEARDVVQESSFNAWQKLGQLRAEDPKAWFLAIVVRQCHSVRRLRWRKVLHLHEEIESSSYGENQIVTRADLSRALRNLHPKYREALFLHFYLDLPLGSVAEILDISVGATKSRINRALKQLRPHLGGHQEEF